MKIRLNKDAVAQDAVEAPAQKRPAKWKWAFAALAGVVLVAYVVSRELRPALPPGAVGFQGAGILLFPGLGWRPAEGGEYAGVKNLCPPVLEGTGRFSGSIIEVLASPNFPKDPREMAKNFYLGLSGDQRVVKDSIHGEEFVAPSGLRGIHLWCRILVQDKDHRGEVAAHTYIVGKADGTCVRINYTASAASDPSVVNQMILSSVAPW